MHFILYAADIAGIFLVGYLTKEPLIEIAPFFILFRLAIIQCKIGKAQ